MGATGELGIDPNSDQHVKKEENGVRWTRIGGRSEFSRIKYMHKEFDIVIFGKKSLQDRFLGRMYKS